MTTLTTELNDHPRSLRSGLDRVKAALGRGFDAYVRAASRSDRIEALQAKTDAELASLGLSRDQIVQYVFRDKMHG